jgi:hypothetical protein
MSLGSAAATSASRTKQAALGVDKRSVNVARGIGLAAVFCLLLGHAEIGKRRRSDSPFFIGLSGILSSVL